MKKILIIIVLIIVIVLAVTVLSNKNTSNISSIIGSWENDGVIYTFNEDGTGKYTMKDISEENFKLEFTYEINSDKISMFFDSEFEEFYGTDTIEAEYSIEDNQLYFTDYVWTKVE